MVLFRGDIKCKSLQRRTSLSVILPADNIHYLQGTEEIAEKPYKTLYLLHGLFGSDDIFLANTTIQKFAEDHNIAVVLPSGENSFYVDQKESHKYYGEFIGRELVEMTRNIFPLSHKKEDTYLAGFSMGGYGAIRNGLKYHDTFGYIGAISAAMLTDDLHNWGEGDDLLSSKSFAQSCFGDLNKVIGSDMDPKFLIDDLIANDIEIPKIFMAVGDNDFLYNENIDYYNYLKSRNVDVEFRCSSGEHTWEFCNDYIKEFIEWLPL
ncbi:alpha/beta hydrolase [Methanobrevibacter smithii]|uniref:alpha/beta hydrolase n=1 Tax=Methanobrevibacter smithii TaxID=2173 RepID=UPI0037DDAF67